MACPIFSLYLPNSGPSAAHAPRLSPSLAARTEEPCRPYLWGREMGRAWNRAWNQSWNQVCSEALFFSSEMLDQVFDQNRVLGIFQVGAFVPHRLNRILPKYTGALVGSHTTKIVTDRTSVE